jgi:hypothetical protein
MKDPRFYFIIIMTIFVVVATKDLKFLFWIGMPALLIVVGVGWLTSALEKSANKGIGQEEIIIITPCQSTRKASNSS